MTRNSLAGFGRTLFVLAAVLFAAFPVYWLFMMAFKTADEVFSVPPVYFPSEVSLLTFRSFFRDDIATVGNSLIVSTFSTIITMILATMCAYSIVRFRTGGPKFTSWILSHRMLPPIVIVIPLFLTFSYFRALDNYFSLILVYVAFNLPFAIWMMRGYIEDIPAAVEESALIDGCTRWQVLFYIVIPMARGGLAATTVFTFIFSWNEFIFALVLAGREIVTYPVKLSGYFSNVQAFWSLAGAMSIIATVPVFIAVVFFQRYLVRGLSMGAIKG
jgi:multiple sugar transport system permease protein